MEKVSLYIPCYNAACFIARCLTGVLRQTYLVDEIIIVDDGSTDKIKDIVSAYPVRIITHGENKGLAAARNTGVVNARNNYIASLDADCEPENQWLERLMRNFGDEKIAGVGGRLFEKVHAGLADEWRRAHMRQSWGEERIANPSFLFGSNAVFRKDILLKTGLYNTHYKTNGEDYEISKRLLGDGYALIYEPEARVHHLRTDTIRSLLRTHWYWSFFGTAGSRPPYTLFNLLCRFYDGAMALFSRWTEDCLSRKLHLLGLDMLVYLHHVSSDVVYYFRQKRNR